MRHDPKCYLWDIQQAAQSVYDATQGMSFDLYVSDERLVRSGIERKLIIVGEAAVRLRRHAESTASRITGLQAIIGLRNVITHQYDAIEHDVVWGIIQEYLPTLIDEVTALLAEE